MTTTIENPFSQSRERAKHALFECILAHHRRNVAADVIDMLQAVRGRVATLEPRDALMSISSLITRTNRDLVDQGLPKIIPGADTYTYQFDA